MATTTYIGRFAPSPTGALHLGSLLAALASFLDARQAGGQWLVRMEDLDPPREQPGAAARILQQLEQHHLFWDGDVVYQSNRECVYLEILQKLQRAGLAYNCGCSRQQIKAMGSLYNGHCRTLKLPGLNTAIRINTKAAPIQQINFDDIFQGSQKWHIPSQCGDFIIRRRDKLFAYQLACAVDDYQQKATHVIRGSDLLDSTPRQLFLMSLINQLDNNNHLLPHYGHIPVASNPNGQKLSKQNLAPELDSHRSSDNLLQALTLLNQNPPSDLIGTSNETILHWAIEHWDRLAVPRQRAILATTG